MFDKKIGATDEKDIQSVASSILIFENPSDDFGSRFDFNGFTKRWEKKRKAIDAAYQAVLGKSEVITERPVLTKNTSEWVRSVGLNPDEMSNEQLAVFAEIDDSKRSNWAVRFLYGVSAVFFLLAGFNLITLEISGFLWNGVISFIAWYIGHKIQMRRVSKKFYEASIIKYAQEQASKA